MAIDGVLNCLQFLVEDAITFSMSDGNSQSRHYVIFGVPDLFDSALPVRL